MTEAQPSALYQRYTAVAGPLTELGWQVVGGGGPEDVYAAGTAAWLTAVWNRGPEGMPSVDSMRNSLADEDGTLPEGYGEPEAEEDSGRTVIRFS